MTISFGIACYVCNAGTHCTLQWMVFGRLGTSGHRVRRRVAVGFRHGTERVPTPVPPLPMGGTVRDMTWNQNLAIPICVQVS